MFGYGFFQMKNHQPVDCDAKSIAICSTAASLADGSLVFAGLSATGKSAVVATAAGATTCAVSTGAMLACGFLFCYGNQPQDQEMTDTISEEEPLINGEKPVGAIDFTPPSAI